MDKTGQIDEKTAIPSPGMAPTTQEPRYPPIIIAIAAPLALPASSMVLQQAPQMPLSTDIPENASSSDTSTTAARAAMWPAPAVRAGTNWPAASRVPLSASRENSIPVSMPPAAKPSAISTSCPTTNTIMARIFPPISATGRILSKSSSTSLLSFSSTTARIMDDAAMMHSIITTMA